MNGTTRLRGENACNARHFLSCTGPVFVLKRALHSVERAYVKSPLQNALGKRTVNAKRGSRSAAPEFPASKSGPSVNA
jgi:hypothetical protein